MKSPGAHGFIRRACVCLASLAATFSLCVAQADDASVDPVRLFNIAAQPLSKALLEFSKQSGLIVTVPPALVEGKSAPEIHGELSSSQVLEKLLSGSGLKAFRIPSGGITIGNAMTSGQGHTIGSVQASAGESGLDKDSTEGPKLTEIIVTAQKREERLQDVPVPVSVAH